MDEDIFFSERELSHLLSSTGSFITFQSRQKELSSTLEDIKYHVDPQLK